MPSLATPCPAPSPPVATAAQPERSVVPSFDSWRFLGIAHVSYALFETPAGVVILERRAALERVWFERLLRQYGEDGVPMQRLLVPLTLELDAISSALLLDHLEFVQTHGFEIGEFGRNFFRIVAIPDWMEADAARAFVEELLGALRDGRLPAGKSQISQEEFARLAATRAVRLPANPPEAEMHALLRELFAGSHPLTSPGGRPTFLEVSHAELGRRLQI